MGGSSATKAANTGNAIAQASLDESKRQYEEQEKKKADDKARAKANALGGRTSANRAYANNFAQPTDFTTGHDNSYSLLTAGGTESIIGSLLGVSQGQNNTLG
jgi:hypothetical protein